MKTPIVNNVVEITAQCEASVKVSEVCPSHNTSPFPRIEEVIAASSQGKQILPILLFIVQFSYVVYSV